jgi:hypothetical protein
LFSLVERLPVFRFRLAALFDIPPVEVQPVGPPVSWRPTYAARREVYAAPEKVSTTDETVKNALVKGVLNREEHQ